MSRICRASFIYILNFKIKTQLSNKLQKWYKKITTRSGNMFISIIRYDAMKARQLNKKHLKQFGLYSPVSNDV